MANNSTNQRTDNPTPQPTTRKEAKQNRETANDRVERKWNSTGSFSIGLRIIIVVVLLVVAAIAGSMIGYGVIGDGNPLGVLNPSTWNHVLDIMNGVESK
ncbi:DNA-directed RNA polymerase subunit beta [Rummeliibacillus pycnus]|uniref:DNA-directed RNA polymerase subunit beta n=1 Tax=Rummeliibacillus pycnus TaxID=101070 RepID=UPI0037C9AEC9